MLGDGGGDDGEEVDDGVELFNDDAEGVVDC